MLLFASLATPLGAQPGALRPPVRGDAHAVLHIVEFSDFECPYCGRARLVLDSLMVRYADAIRIEYRHYPLPMHRFARKAAEAAVEAQRQRAFWSYHDLLFSHQDRLVDGDLVGYADSLGLDAAAMRRALESGEHAARVEADVALGLELAVTGTPTFFINGYRVTGVPPVWVFDLALRAFRAGRVASREPVRPSGGADRVPRPD